MTLRGRYSPGFRIAQPSRRHVKLSDFKGKRTSSSRSTIGVTPVLRAADVFYVSD